MSRRRVPQGTCGLKYLGYGRLDVVVLSGPARDLWIEIDLNYFTIDFSESGPARDLWIEMMR